MNDCIRISNRQGRTGWASVTPLALITGIALLGWTPDQGQAQTAPQATIQAPTMAAPALPDMPVASTDPVADAMPSDPAPEAATALPAPQSASQPASQSTSGDTSSMVAPEAAMFDTLRSLLPSSLHAPSYAAQGATQNAARFLREGGPAIWAISVLSVITLALILWKIWRLARIGAWSRGKAFGAVTLWEADRAGAALALVHQRRGLRSRVVSAALQSCLTLPEDAAREETTRVAKHQLAEATTGLRALELISTVAPLLGLLGTVMGMIAAFQALQESGSRADPSMLAGGIWEALLTTAAGMAVAIPASAALTWFEAVIDRMRRDVEDAAARIFVHQSQSDQQPPEHARAQTERLAAE